MCVCHRASSCVVASVGVRSPSPLGDDSASPTRRPRPSARSNRSVAFRQPSAKVFAGFDDALVLSGGRPAYLGPAASLGSFCASIGAPVPPEAEG